jgi:hypothetical protein
VVLRSALSAFCLVVALGAVAGDARADDEEAKVQAKALADTAYDKMQQGQLEEALALFEQADQIYHSPMFVVFMGDAEDKLGHLTRARDHYKRAAEETLPAVASDSFTKAQGEARDRLAKIEPRVPRLEVEVVGGRASILVDNHTLTAAEVGSPFPVDPGLHRIVATGASGTRAEESVDVAEGETRKVTLTLGQGPVGDTDSGGAGVPGWVPAAVGYGVGGAGLVMGIAAGAIFLDKLSALHDRCQTLSGDENRCAPEEAEEGDSIETLGNVSTAGFVIAGVGVAVGTVLLVVWATGDSETEGDTTEPSAELGLTPSGVELRARF